MHLLLCNDDGYKANGINILAKQLALHGHKITIVAPKGERSAQSHSMSFYQPVSVLQVSDNVFAVDGTPADCAAIGLTRILAETKPDFVVSGINHGLNVGIDINYSGTVGAATEATLMGYKAIAVSADMNGGPESEKTKENFVQAAELVAQILANVNLIEWPKLEVLNINVPLNAKNIAVAECGGESLYVPNFEELLPTSKDNMKIYLIGGNSRFMPNDMSQDVSLISSGFSTLSFVQAKQSSSQGNKKLENLFNKLKL